jgi:hypothetical protein
VIPVALGGSDDPSNLVTACVDCNGGKTSIAPDSAVVADVSADALRWKDALKQAAAERAAEYAGNRAVHDQFQDLWNAWTFDGRTVPLPSDFGSSVNTFLAAGLTFADLEELIDVTMAMKTVKTATHKWKYFCGCCWKLIKQSQERAQEIASHQGAEQKERQQAEQERHWQQEQGNCWLDSDLRQQEEAHSDEMEWESWQSARRSDESAQPDDAVSIGQIFDQLFSRPTTGPLVDPFGAWSESNVRKLLHYVTSHDGSGHDDATVAQWGEEANREWVTDSGLSMIGDVFTTVGTFFSQQEHGLRPNEAISPQAITQMIDSYRRPAAGERHLKAVPDAS